MLKLLLDEQISPDVAEGLRRRSKNITVCSLAEWERGRFLGEADDELLKAAAQRGFSLVTYDRRTIPPLLKLWAEEGRDHAGVIFVGEKTIPSANFGTLIRALEQLHRETGKWDWTNRIFIIRR